MFRQVKAKFKLSKRGNVFLIALLLIPKLGKAEIVSVSSIVAKKNI